MKSYAFLLVLIGDAQSLKRDLKFCFDCSENWGASKSVGQAHFHFKKISLRLLIEVFVTFGRKFHFSN